MEQTQAMLTTQLTSLAWLPLVAVLIPVVGVLLVVVFQKKEKIRNIVVVLTSFAVFVSVCLMYKPVVEGVKISGHLYKGLQLVLSHSNGVATGFSVDATSLIFAFITSFLWLVGSVYAISYMSHEHARNRFYIFLLLTLAVNLGVVLAKDFLTLFAFFEMLSLFSLVLVIHTESKEALSAGKLYILIGAVGGFLLLFGILALYIYTGQLNIVPMANLIERTVPPGMRSLIVAFMIIGFGVKAGMVPVHVWLPDAHPVAPTPASALLSGVMIKAGAYGILRTVNTLFAPAAEKVAEKTTHLAAAAHQWTTLTSLGYALICIGVITMFSGVINALLSHNCKRMLAYHSVSQMGYIIFGLGCAAYLGKDGAMGLAGSLYHIVNHALFKGLLFLCIGAVYFRTHELDMFELGGLWRNMPFTAIACFIAACGISGVPLFNGFASKTLLHHAAVEVIEHSAKISAAHRPDTLLVAAEIFFILTAFGTFCSNMKMWLLVFVGKRPEKFKDTKEEPSLMKLALFALSAAILLIGLWPNFLLEKMIGPALASFGFESSAHAYHILFNVHTLRSTIPILYDPKSLAVVGSYEVVHNLLAASLVVVGAGAYFVLGFRYRWFYFHSPEWTSVKYWYIRIGKRVVAVGAGLGALVYDYWDKVIIARTEWAAKKIASFCRFTRRLNGCIDWTVSTSLVDAWLSRPGEKITLSTSALLAEEVVEEMPPRVVAVTPKEAKKINFPSLGDICAQIKKIDHFWDRFLTRILVEVWVSEPAGTIVALQTNSGLVEEIELKLTLPTVEAKGAKRRAIHLLPTLNILKQICQYVTKVDNYWDRFLTRILVEVWVAEPTGTVVAQPGLIEEIELPSTLAASVKKAISLPSALKQICQYVTRIEHSWDRFLTRILVETWVVEPTDIIVTRTVPSEPPSLPSTITVREKWLKILFMRLCYLAKNTNYYLDRVLSMLFVDMWLSEPIVTVTKGIKKGPAPRISVFRRLNAYLDQVISDIKVDVWQTAPARAEKVVAISVQEAKRKILEAPIRSYEWVRGNFKQIINFFLGLVIIITIVITLLIALGYIRF